MIIMVGLVIKIKEYIFQKEISTGTGGGITTPLEPITPKIEPVSRDERIVKILAESRLPNANEGEIVQISAVTYCKSGETISKPRGSVYLLVDGAVADEKYSENGSVTFEWQATAVPISQHVICVRVDPSEACKSFGQDCRRIYVNPVMLNPAEQLARERASASEQRKLIEQARKGLREEIIEATFDIPGYPTQGTYAPEVPITIIPSTPITTPTPDVGIIELTGLPIPILADMPLYVYLDGARVGRVYELPKTLTNIQTGSHEVYIVAGDFTSPKKTVFVTKGQTTSVTI